MKKNFLNIKTILFGVGCFSMLSITSCDKYLDQQPLSDISTELFWRDAEDAKLGIAGMYDGMQATLSNNYIDWTEPRSDNFRAASNNDAQLNLALNALDANMPQTSWKELYSTISRANFAIKYIPTIASLDESTKNSYLAEALAMRAFSYFYAVRLWGDVPLWLEPYEDLKQDPNRPRVSKDEILDNVIISDLIKAKGLINPANNSVWTINLGGILAILSDVYAWKRDYPNVISTTQELMSLNRYSLVNGADWGKLFTSPASTKENIWSVNWNFAQDGANGMAHRYGSSNITSFYYIDDAVLQLFESNPNDIRRSLTYDVSLVSAGVGKIGKFYEKGANGKPVYPSTTESAGYFTMYRYADILLLRAEALNALSFAQNKTESLGLVNQIRLRANVSAIEGNVVQSQSDLANIILSERQIELFGEGKRWFDIIRANKVLEIMDPVIRNRQRIKFLPETGFGDIRRVLLPISRTALNENIKLTQNPPYSE